MARRVSRGKRFTYVTPVHDASTSNSDADLSDNELSYNATSPDNLSVRNLMRHSQTYEKSEDHGYTSRRISKRSISSTDSAIPTKKKKRCESKNAINARINRERKKAYVAQLEGELDELRKAGKHNAEKVISQEATIRNLTNEVSQLKSFLANNKYLGALVSKLSHVTGLPVTSSLFANQEARNSAPQPRIRSVPYASNHPIARTDVNLNSGHENSLYFPPEMVEDTSALFPKMEPEDFIEFDPNEFLPFDCDEPLSEFDRNVGICLHINQDRLSVEFCTVCNAKAH